VTRLNLLLLAIDVVCAMSLVRSQYEARRALRESP
jgi:cell division protein FtsL